MEQVVVPGAFFQSPSDASENEHAGELGAVQLVGSEREALMGLVPPVWALPGVFPSAAGEGFLRTDLPLGAFRGWGESL